MATHEATTREAEKPYSRLFLPLAAASATALCSCAAAVLRRRALRDLCIPSLSLTAFPHINRTLPHDIGLFSSAGIGICTGFDVTTNTVAISFVFVNYCPNID